MLHRAVTFCGFWKSWSEVQHLRCIALWTKLVLLYTSEDKDTEPPSSQLLLPNDLTATLEKVPADSGNLQWYITLLLYFGIATANPSLTFWPSWVHIVEYSSKSPLVEWLEQFELKCPIMHSVIFAEEYIYRMLYTQTIIAHSNHSGFLQQNV